MPAKRKPFGGGGNGLIGRLGADSDTTPKTITLAALVVPEDLVGLVDSLLDQGAAFMIGRTSDGGALSLAVFVDGEKIKRYIPDVEAWRHFMEQVAE